MKRAFAWICVVFLVSGSALAQASKPQSSGMSPAAAKVRAQSKAAQTPKAKTAPAEKEQTESVAVLQTKLGKIVIRFFPEKAPNHVKNFLALCKSGFYNGTQFHRIIPGFMIQGGDPNTKSGDPSTWGLGSRTDKDGKEITLKAEFNDIHHARGIVSMARSQDPNSASSQFFICVADAGALDHQYTAFGEVIQGMDVVDKIANAPAKMGGGGDSVPSLPVSPVAIDKAIVEKRPPQTQESGTESPRPGPRPSPRQGPRPSSVCQPPEGRRLKMHAKRTSVALGILALACFALVLGCARGPIKLLLAAPFTGGLAKDGQDTWNGAELAVEDWNAKGGVNGRTVQLIKADDKGDPDTALSLAKQYSGKVDAVIGHFNSACTEAAEEIYGKDHVLMITPASTKPDITGVYLTVLRVCGTNDQQGASAAKYVAEHFPGAKVAVVHDKSSYGQDLTSEFLKNYEFLTKTQAAFYGSIDRSQALFTDVINRIKPLDPTVLYFGGVWPQGAEFLKEMRQAGMNATFVSGDGCFDPTFIKTVGPAAEGALMAFIPDQEKIPTAKPIVDAYKRKYGEIGPYSLYAYTAVTVALQGMAKAGTTDGSQVARALFKMEANTPFGAMRFNEKGDPQQSPYVMWKVVNGKFVEVPMNAPAAPSK